MSAATATTPSTPSLRVEAPVFHPAQSSSSSSASAASTSSTKTTTSTASTVPSSSSSSSAAPSLSSSSSSTSTTASTSSNDSEPSSSSYIPIRDAAAKLHESLSNSNYSVVRLGVGIADSVTQTALSLVPEPVVAKVQQIGNPIVDAADKQLENAYNRLQPVAATVSARVQAATGRFNRAVSEQVGTAQQYLVPASWFVDVDELLKKTVGGRKPRLQVDPADLQPLLQSFYNVAAYQFLTLARRGQQSKDEFLAALESALESNWTDTLKRPATTFFNKAREVYEQAGLKARDITTTVLLERVKPLFGEDAERQIVACYVNDRTSKLIYVSSLQLFKQLQQKVKEKKIAAEELQAEFLTGMKQKLGAVYNDGLEPSLKELIAAWTSEAERQSKSLQSGVYDRYQYLLLSALNVFDRVLPPVMSGEEDDEDKDEAAASNGPITLRDVASHVIDRVGERGVVGNVTTASSNSVKESVQLAGHVATQGVTLAQNVASQAVQTVESVVRPVVTPVVARVQPIVQPIVQPYVDRAKPVVDAVNKELTTRQQQISAQLQASMQSVTARIQSLQQYVKQLASQTGQAFLSTANDTKTQLSATATSAATTIHSSLPQPIAKRLDELQVRMSSAVQYASELRQNKQLQQQLAQLSHSYAEVLRAIVTEQLHALSENVGVAERLGQLAEDARDAVQQVILVTKKALALEKGEDDADVRDDDATATAAPGARKAKDEEKSSAREVV